ncbi:DUF1937 family protein [Pararhodobacter zhoushanensis]|uniref:DUF1937 family protein n=1 Tax=Pararhodobacter zhoushanensis TaxID=2479545 RepID=A0ABT3H427_9RHOB|nr:DUF1937 family protein [Pararhodobacter zhoushanensis]MCW1934553.1 DUF1937 family protein [Pararhodobacter zhoushanensis]
MNGFDDLRGSLLVHWGQSSRDVAHRASGLVYLATPYTKRAAPGGVFDWAAAESAARDAAECANVLSLLARTAVSPVVMAHQMIAAGRGKPWQRIVEAHALDADFWSDWCGPMLWACRFVYVPNLPGWRECDGVARAIAQAHDAGKVILIEARQRPTISDPRAAQSADGKGGRA